MLFAQTIAPETLISFWWILIFPILIFAFKPVLRVLFGMVIVPEDRIGIVTKKFALSGRIASCRTAEFSRPKARLVFRLVPWRQGFTG